MTFGCPICSERLDRCPAHKEAKNVDSDDIDVASTPCGHIFHTFCIQKWLTGNIASSKLCPCCRKHVPGMKVLPLFPNGFTNLDESIDEADGEAARSCDHSHFNQQLSSLKKLVESLQDQKKENDEMLLIERSDSVELRKKLEAEKLRSDHYMFNWKRSESYKTYAEQQEREVKDLKEKLQQYQTIDALIRNVKEDVKYDLNNYTPSMESVKKLLETYHVISGELNTACKKLSKAQANQETDRLEISKWRRKFKDLDAAHAELKRVHTKCYNPNTTIVLDTPSPIEQSKSAGFLKAMQATNTPLLKQAISKSKRKLQDPPAKIDTDVVLLKPQFGKKPKLAASSLRKRGIESSQSSSTSTKSDQEPAKKMTKTCSVEEKQPEISNKRKPVDERPCNTPPKKYQPKSKFTSPPLQIYTSDESDDELRGNIVGMNVVPRVVKKFTFKKK